MRKLSKRFARDERAVTLIEYALIAMLIVICIFAAVSSLGGAVTAEWSAISSAVNGA